MKELHDHFSSLSGLKFAFATEIKRKLLGATLRH